MNTILKKIQKLGIVPIVKLEEVSKAEALAKALCDGGLPCAEVTYRTDACTEVIKAMKRERPEMLMGAGTVLRIEQVDEAIEAGAEFIVSPGFNPSVVKYCVEKKITIIPGCTSPSDIEQAIQCGLEVVKFFPAEAAGGLPMIKALAAPYQNMCFMPTGGIGVTNLKSYLEDDKILACGGTFMLPAALIEADDFDGIQKLTYEAVKKMFGFELAHIGLNTESSTEAEGVVGLFEAFFGFERAENSNSIFAGRYIEAMRVPYLGEKGHIGIFTDQIERAVDHFERRGITFNQSSAKYNDRQKLSAIYFEQDFGGFALHLVQKGK